MATPGQAFTRLVEIMRALRAPEGCPWDREQTLTSLRPFVLEETYELLEALDHGDMVALREELGDFLYEAVFLAQIAEEAGHFSITDAVHGIADKLVRRHPHVFTPDGRPLAEAGDRMTPDQIVRKWEDLKAGERQASGRQVRSVLAGVPRVLPSLLRAYELSARAAAVGFDWTAAHQVLDKIDEEVAELRAAVAAHGPGAREAEDELGDVFFALANLARLLGHEPEAALRKANDKFQRRFQWMEAAARSGQRLLREMTLDELEALWQQAKAAEDGVDR